jgi:circadian clock protein KaiC
MCSVGIDLQRWVDSGLLQFRCSRPTLLGLEAHLVAMQTAVNEFDPSAVVIDPISDMVRIGTGDEVSSMLIRIVDFLKGRGTTTMCTRLYVDTVTRTADDPFASLVDTSLRLETVEGNGEHNRLLSVLKSRGMAHSNQIREFLLTDQGIELADVYVGPQGVLTGSARQAQEANEVFEGARRLEDLEQRRINLERRRESVQAETENLWREFQDESDAVSRLLSQGSTGADDRAGQRSLQALLRRADHRHEESSSPIDAIEATMSPPTEHRPRGEDS